jgi:tetratricopeptide (TPR) repeat protein
VTHRDDRGLPLSTACAAARDAYCDGVARLLGARAGIEAALGDAIAADPSFALAHAALARAHQAHARGAQARATMAEALVLAERALERERSHVHALARVVAGDPAGALDAIRAHLGRWPRDVVVMAPCGGVFGLFGFSGRAGRERALREFVEPFAPALGDDPWYLTTRGFARCETGDVAAGRGDVERALGLDPASANTAHIHAHVLYEAGEDARAVAWLRDWLSGYAREGMMHCHLNWHVALSALAVGDRATAWATYDDAVAPGAAWGPPLNLVTDATSFVLRAALCGEPIPGGAWTALAEVARRAFPQPGVAFADAHVALALAMAGDSDGLARLRVGAVGPAADVVVALADAFAAFAREDWAGCWRALEPVLPVHERIGGSRAQRDLIEQVAWVAVRRGGLDVDWRPRGTRPMPAGLSAV